MNRPTKLSCRNLWQVFGTKPKRFLQQHNHAPTWEQLTKEGYIGAVRDVSFDVYAGEILMIMGLSGSGKSTLIRCLTRLIEPTAGEVLFDGKDLLSASEQELIDIRLHKMGMVFQHFGLLPHRTVLENVAFPLEIQGMAPQEREARAREMVTIVGLEGREDYYPRELSGGQQQRVGIARSLAVQPEVWFLDEPFSALDPLIRREMQDEFMRLQKMLHKTIVFITHDFDEAIRLGDHIAIMKDGEIVQLGTAEELVLHPADDYVAQFTRNAPTGKLIPVSAVMADPVANLDTANSIPGSAKLDQVAHEVLSQDATLSVVDEDGEAIGSLPKENLINALFERGADSEHRQ